MNTVASEYFFIDFTSPDSNIGTQDNWLCIVLWQAYHFTVLSVVSTLLVNLCCQAVPPLFHIPLLDNMFRQNVIPGEDTLLSQIAVVYVILFLAVLEKTGKILTFNSFFLSEKLISHYVWQTGLVGECVDSP